MTSATLDTLIFAFRNKYNIPKSWDIHSWMPEVQNNNPMLKNIPGSYVAGVCYHQPNVQIYISPITPNKQVEQVFVHEAVHGHQGGDFCYFHRCLSEIVAMRTTLAIGLGYPEKYYQLFMKRHLATPFRENEKTIETMVDEVIRLLGVKKQ